MKQFWLSFICILAAGVIFAQSPQTTQADSHDLDLKGMDRSVDPCTDFYQYANGTWLANNPIPADRSS